MILQAIRHANLLKLFV